MQPAHCHWPLLTLTCFSCLAEQYLVCAFSSISWTSPAVARAIPRLSLFFMQLFPNILSEMANSVDPDQTAPFWLKEQSDLGLHCLHMPFCQKIWHTNFRTFTIKCSWLCDQGRKCMHLVKNVHHNPSLAEHDMPCLSLNLNTHTHTHTKYTGKNVCNICVTYTIWCLPVP